MLYFSLVSLRQRRTIDTMAKRNLYCFYLLFYGTVICFFRRSNSIFYTQSFTAAQASDRGCRQRFGGENGEDRRGATRIETDKSGQQKYI